MTFACHNFTGLHNHPVLRAIVVLEELRSAEISNYYKGQIDKTIEELKQFVAMCNPWEVTLP